MKPPTRINDEVTPFQRKVYDALRLIPKGKVTTYKILGVFIKCKSAQAIGQALTRNPNAPEVPCHRVIKTDKTIGGYAFGSEKKKKLLASEGVMFDTKNRLVEEERVWEF